MPSPRLYRSILDRYQARIHGKDNIVADALSRVEKIAALDYEALAISQETDDELKIYLNGSSALQLKRVQLPGTPVSVYCDVSSTTARPFVTEQFRRAAFESVHQLAHPGIKATVKLVTQRFVWPSIKSDYRRWARSCIECQR